MRKMTKNTAIKRFGGISKLAEAINVSPSRISQLDNRLSENMHDRIGGAMVRKGMLMVQENRVE